MTSFRGSRFVTHWTGGTNYLHPGTKWFQPEVDFAKVILLNKLQKKFFQILTPDTILEFWESINFEHLTLGILTLPPRSSRLVPRNSIMVSWIPAIYMILMQHIIWPTPHPTRPTSERVATN